MAAPSLTKGRYAFDYGDTAKMAPVMLKKNWMRWLWLKNRLKKNPKAFEALAKEKSKDRGSKGNGGDLGWFDPRGMVPEFGAGVAKLAKGKFSEEPVKSQFGYHVILLEDTRAQQVQPLEQIKPALTQQMQQQNLKKLFDEMKAKAKIEIVKAPAPVPAPAQESKPAESIKK